MSATSSQHVHETVGLLKNWGSHELVEPVGTISTKRFQTIR